MQFQSEVLGVEVIRPKITETTALGAAYLAGLAVGYWDSLDAVKQQWQQERAFSPEMGEDKVNMLKDGWRDAIGRTLSGK